MSITVGILSTSANIRPSLERCRSRGSCDRRTRKWDVTEFEGGSRQNPRGFSPLAVERGKHRCDHTESLWVLPAQQRCSCSQGCGEGLAQLAMAWLLQHLRARAPLHEHIPQGSRSESRARHLRRVPTEAPGASTCHCLVQDVTSKTLLVLNLHFIPYVEPDFCSLLLHCCLWKCLLVTAIMEYSISVFYNSAEFCSRIYFVQCCFSLLIGRSGL